jgi:hypothetical protein
MKHPLASTLLLLWTATLLFALCTVDPGSARVSAGFATNFPREITASDPFCGEMDFLGDPLSADNGSAPAISGPLHLGVLSSLAYVGLGPFGDDLERRDAFLRRLLLPERSRDVNARGVDRDDRRLLEHLLETEGRFRSWEKLPTADPETVS